MKSNASRTPLLVLAAILILILISAGQHSRSASGMGVVREGYAGIHQIVSAPLRLLANLWGHYIFLVYTAQENDELRGQLAELEVRCMTQRELRAENERLRAMLEFKRAYRDFRLHPASLLTQDITLVFKTAIIDGGSRSGFFKDMPIVNPDGIVGRVISVSPHTSQVLLITDPNSAVPALIEATRVKGIVKGRGSGLLGLEYVRRTEEVSVGDFVVTSGLLGIFPKGLRLGQVLTIQRDEHQIFADITLTPCVKMRKIEEVFGIEHHVAY